MKTKAKEGRDRERTEQLRECNKNYVKRGQEKMKGSAWKFEVEGRENQGSGRRSKMEAWDLNINEEDGRLYRRKKWKKGN